MKVICVIRFDESIIKHDSCSVLSREIIDGSLEYLKEIFPSVRCEDIIFNKEFLEKHDNEVLNTLGGGIWLSMYYNLPVDIDNKEINKFKLTDIEKHKTLWERFMLVDHIIIPNGGYPDFRSYSIMLRDYE